MSDDARSPPPDAGDPLRRLLSIMARLRTPETGCPWDLEQSFQTIAPYTIEEAYEVAEAIAQGDMAELKEELGDLLLQVVFHARMAEEAGAFSFDDVTRRLNDKLIDRHPHVFGTSGNLDSAAQTVSWENIKAEERRTKGHRSLLDGVALALPALMRAEKLQKRASRIGFDWEDPALVLNKIEEEVAELRAALDVGDGKGAVEETGDLLFAVANLARHLKIDPEEALRQGNRKFERRFRIVERMAGYPSSRSEAPPLEQLEQFWKAAKAQE